MNTNKYSDAFIKQIFVHYETLIDNTLQHVNQTMFLYLYVTGIETSYSKRVVSKGR